MIIPLKFWNSPPNSLRKKIQDLKEKYAIDSLLYMSPGALKKNIYSL